MIGFVAWPPFIIVYRYEKRWPSDKANYTCENMLSFKELQIFDKVTSCLQLISNLLVAPAYLQCCSDFGPVLFYTPGVFV